jgi:hypothetical protein
MNPAGFDTLVNRSHGRADDRCRLLGRDHDGLTATRGAPGASHRFAVAANVNQLINLKHDFSPFSLHSISWELGKRVLKKIA